MNYFLAICTAFLFLIGAVSPASGSYFKNLYFPTAYSYSIDTSPVLVDCSLPGVTVTELAVFDHLVLGPGTIFNVSLMETDPHLNWAFLKADGVLYMGNGLIETFPVRHVFKLRAYDPCTVRFSMADDRTGKLVRTFSFNLVVDRPLSGLGWPAFSPDLTPSFGWPPILKF